MTDLVRHLRESATDLCSPDGCCYAESMVKAADEIERLQRIIDSRPAINAGLPETYIEWSHSI